MSQPMLHRGARQVSRHELATVEAPPATETWYPKKHMQVLNAVVGTLEGSGLHVERESLALARADQRFFGTLDLSVPVADGVGLAVGIRNSTDKSFPLGFCAGSRVMVCDNLAFHSELIVTRKHTKHGEVRFEEAIAQAVQSLHQFRQAEADRVRRFRAVELSEDAANSYLLQAFEENLVSSRLLPQVIAEWRSPKFEEFAPRNLFSLLNAFTTRLSEQRNTRPAEYAAHTMRLQRFLASRADLGQG
jgi:hypothetical protein